MPSEKPNRWPLRLALLHMPLMLDRRARPGRCRVSDILADLDCMTPAQAALFNQAEEDTYTGRAAAEIRRLRAELAERALVDSESSSPFPKGYWIERCDAAEAKLARVRELCAGHLKGDLGDYVQTAQVLAAIEDGHATIARVRNIEGEQA